MHDVRARRGGHGSASGRKIDRLKLRGFSWRRVRDADKLNKGVRRRDSIRE